MSTEKDTAKVVSVAVSEIPIERLPYEADRQIALLEESVDRLRVVRNSLSGRHREVVGETIRDLRALVIAIKHPEGGRGPHRP